jgi:Malate/lactate dehydrogenases
VQQRGKAVIDARGASSATSAAKAALDTVIACENITSSDDCFSAAVYSDGAYGVPEGIMCGFPLMTTPSGEIEIIRDLTLSDSARSRLNLSIDELLSEREAVEDLL